VARLKSLISSDPKNQPDTKQVEETALNEIEEAIQIWKQSPKLQDERLDPLTDHGRKIISTEEGSIILQILCPTPSSAKDLWLKSEDGTLSAILNSILSGLVLPIYKDLTECTFSATIDKNHYKDILAALEDGANQNTQYASKF